MRFCPSRALSARSHEKIFAQPEIVTARCQTSASRRENFSNETRFASALQNYDDAKAIEPCRFLRHRKSRRRQRKSSCVEFVNATVCGAASQATRDARVSVVHFL